MSFVFFIPRHICRGVHSVCLMPVCPSVRPSVRELTITLKFVLKFLRSHKFPNTLLDWVYFGMKIKNGP